MTLRDKFLTDKSISTSGESSRFARQCEKIADDYAVEFGEWLRTEAYDAGDNWIYLHDNQDYTTEQLLEIFKKEKGL